MGKAWVLVGDSGAGQIAKVCNQIIVGAQMVALAEALSRRRNRVWIPAGWSRPSRAARRKCGRWMSSRRVCLPAIASRVSKPICSIKTWESCWIPAELTVFRCPMTAVVQQLYTAMLEQGNRELDNSAIISVYELLANLTSIEPYRQ